MRAIIIIALMAVIGAPMASRAVSSCGSQAEHVYTLYLQRQTDREQAELDYKIRNGLPL